jgi:hypothetical protein
MAIIYGLMPDEKWNARFNPSGPEHQAGWAAVMGVVIALMVGAGVLMATLAFSMQRIFEYQQLTSLVSFQASNAACSLALKPDGVVASRRHSQRA